MTFDTWWKEHGSLLPHLFNLTHDQRELYRLVAAAAWVESDHFTREELGDLEDESLKLDNQVSELKDQLRDANLARAEALEDIETLKESIRSCL